MKFIAAGYRELCRLYTNHRRPFLLYFLLLALLLGRGLNYGFMGDESGYVTLNTEELASHPFLPFITGVDTGHPMLYAYPVAVLWRLFGQSNAVANVSIWIWAAVALTAVHRLIELILAGGGPVRKRPAWGMVAALAFCSTPLFISLAAQYLDPIPYLALLLCLILAWATGRRKWIAVLACVVPLVRITACLSVLGLGLFDLEYAYYVRRQRSWRQRARVLAPYAAGGALFLLYLLVKLAVLDRPMATIAVNKSVVTSWDQIGRSTRWVLEGMLNLPYYSFKPLLAMALLGALVALWRAFHLRAKARTPNPRSECELQLVPRGLALHGACIASMFVPTLFYCLYPNYPQPRYLIAWHVFFVLMAVHGLFVLFRQRLWLALPLLLPWCGLQVARWHAHWTERVFASAPRSLSRQMRISPGNCLDVQDRKKMCHQAVRWVEKNNTAGARLVGIYPTQTIFQSRAAGFTRRPEVVYFMSVIAQGSPEALVRKLLKQHSTLYVIFANWDVLMEQRVVNSLMPKFQFQELFVVQNKSRDWIKIYSCRLPPPSTEFRTASR